LYNRLLYTTFLSTPPTVLATSALSLMNVSPSQISYLSPNPAIIILINSAPPPPYLDSKTASTIATSIVHSKSQTINLLQIHNFLARAVVKFKALKSCHTITYILRCQVHWLKITEEIEYKQARSYVGVRVAITPKPRPVPFQHTHACAIRNIL